jgi:hypothetical protein
MNGRTSKVRTAALLLLSVVVAKADGAFDRLDEALTASWLGGDLRTRVSGTVDLESYRLSQPPPGLIYAEGEALFAPRLSLFFDAQIGAHAYAFVQARADRGFDPSDEGLRGRVDEYAVRLTPAGHHISVQVGKFATVVGNWVPRHDSWRNPFINAPVPYENLTGIWDVVAPRNTAQLLGWAHLRGPDSAQDELADKHQRTPIIWGPNYTTGVAISGNAGRLDYAVELKNSSLSSHPGVWTPAETRWRYPTVSGRIGYRPSAMWNFGASASAGSYLRTVAEPTLPPGRTLASYRQLVLGEDVAFAWHHLQAWAEVFASRFEIPRVGHADTVAYYVETKYKFTPQWFGALRWNQQLFGTLADSPTTRVRWGRNLWRLDLAPTLRFTAHAQLKLQYSLQHEEDSPRTWRETTAAQFTVRF